ncbi:MAG: GntR family transcriptional regulator [Clostridia bacterium]|nr:GntR family transcriptional regulator [Clostridia bacterium]
MRIFVSNEAGVPIYEQIKTQLRSQIIKGELLPDAMLPSIRTLAKELKVGIITAKRAYDDLCAEGFIYTVQGKGVFVAKFDKKKAEIGAMTELQSRLEDVKNFCLQNSVDEKTAFKLFKEIWEG